MFHMEEAIRSVFNSIMQCVVLTGCLSRFWVKNESLAHDDIFGRAPGLKPLAQKHMKIMSVLTRNEVRHRLQSFAKKWRDANRENADAKPF
jgi:hypothetical protein